MGEKDKMTSGDAEQVAGLVTITWCYFAWISERYICKLWSSIISCYNQLPENRIVIVFLPVCGFLQVVW